mgnify:CR=1 FL=1
MYANGSSVLSKTPEALERLHKLKLSLVYMGLESGNEDVLRLAGKDDTAAHMTEAVFGGAVNVPENIPQRTFAIAYSFVHSAETAGIVRTPP